MHQSFITWEEIKKTLSSEALHNKKINLLLGNGFSISFNLNFNYDFLIDKMEIKNELKSMIKKHNNVEFFLDLVQNDFKKLLYIFDITDYDKQLDSLTQYIKEEFKNTLHHIDQYSNKIYNEHDSEIKKRNRFWENMLLTYPLNTGGKIFTTNYDRILSYIVMKNDEMRKIKCQDGFRKNKLGELEWRINSQNIFYLHGNLAYYTDHFSERFQDDDSNYYSISHSFLNKLSFDILNNSENFSKLPYSRLIVLEGSSENKLSMIHQNNYLSHSYNNLKKVKDYLITYGFSFSSFDQHIIDAINCAAEISENLIIYIGIYQGTKSISEKDINLLKEKFHKNCTVYLYDTEQIEEEITHLTIDPI